MVLADSIEKVNEIDKDRAEEAKQRAEERLRKKSEENIDEARARAALNRALNRLNAVKKYSLIYPDESQDLWLKIRILTLVQIPIPKNNIPHRICFLQASLQVYQNALTGS